jgi:hypothetical protein
MTDAQVDEVLAQWNVAAQVRASLMAYAAADGFDLSVAVATALETWARTPSTSPAGDAPSGYVVVRKIGAARRHQH